MQTANPAVSFLKGFRSEDDTTTNLFIDAYTRYLLTEANAYEFPVKLDQVFRHFQFSVRAAPLGNRRGLITPELQIFSNAFDPRQVQLFSQAHELIEPLFMALQDYDLPWLSDEELQSFLDEKEDYCEYGAAQLLMPMEFFLPFVENIGFSLQTARGISRVTGLSLTATVRRMLDTDLREAIFVIWKYGHRTEDIERSKRLFLSEEFRELIIPPTKPRVAKDYCSPKVELHVRWNKSVEDDTAVAIAKAFVTGSGAIVRGYDYLEITSKFGCYFTEAMYVAYDGVPKVMSLIYFDDAASEPYILGEII